MRLMLGGKPLTNLGVPTMRTDLVVDEIHQIRQKMLAEVGGDIHAFMAKIRAEQAAGGRVVIESTRLPKPHADKQAAIFTRTSP